MIKTLCKLSSLLVTIVTSADYETERGATHITRSLRLVTPFGLLYFAIVKRAAKCTSLHITYRLISPFLRGSASFVLTIGRLPKE